MNFFSSWKKYDKIEIESNCCLWINNNNKSYRCSSSSSSSGSSGKWKAVKQQKKFFNWIVVWAVYRKQTRITITNTHKNIHTQIRIIVTTIENWYDDDDDNNQKVMNEKKSLSVKPTKKFRFKMCDYNTENFVRCLMILISLLLLLIVHNDGFTLFHGVFVFFMWVQFNLVFIFLIFSFSTASVGNFICLNSVNDACVCFCDIFTVMVGWLTVWLSGSIWFSFLVFNSIYSFICMYVWRKYVVGEEHKVFFCCCLYSFWSWIEHDDAHEQQQ